MHGWGVVDLRVNLAKKNHGYSIPARSYDFCPHLTQLDILDFTLSHIQPYCQTKDPHTDILKLNYFAKWNGPKVI